MEFTRVYVDSNIFIRALEGEPDDVVSVLLLDLFRLSGERNRRTFATSQMTLAEILVHPIRTRHLTRQVQYKALLSASNNWLHVLPVSRTILIDAATFRVTHKLKLPDAIHLSTGRQAGCSHILTGDKDFGERSLAPTESNLADLQDWLRA